jgi:transposase
VPSDTVVVLSRQDRDELETRRRSRSARTDDVQRARLILIAEREAFHTIQERLDCGRTYIRRWKGRFMRGGLAGLFARHRGREASALTPAVEARIFSATKKKPDDGSTHWSTRRLATKLGVSHMLVPVFSRKGPGLYRSIPPGSVA